MNTPSPSPRGWRARIALGLMACSVVAPFVDFASNTSALDVVVGCWRSERSLDSSEWLILSLAVPLFLGCLVTAGRFAQLGFGRLGWGGLLVAGASVALVVGMDVFITIDFARVEDWSWEMVQLLVIPGLWIAGTWWLRRHRQRLEADNRLVIAALEVAFIAHAAFLLVLFRDDAESGWWLTLLALAGAAFDLVTFTPRPASAAAEPVPVTP
jgi:hypothetical protein